jgi:hypothetical protein
MKISDLYYTYFKDDFFTGWVPPVAMNGNHDRIPEGMNGTVFEKPNNGRVL